VGVGSGGVNSSTLGAEEKVEGVVVTGASGTVGLAKLEPGV
jgi:hypothetical protein